jgi:4-coumarate--CoA ligase
LLQIDGVTGETTTYSELHTQIWKVGSSLHKLGLRKGDVVTIFAPNCPQYAVMYVALQAMGVIASAVNPVYTTGM